MTFARCCLGGDLAADYLCIECCCLPALLWNTRLEDVSHLREATAQFSLSRQSYSLWRLLVNEQVHCLTNVLAHSVVVLVEDVNRTTLEDVAKWESQKCTLQC